MFKYYYVQLHNKLKETYTKEKFDIDDFIAKIIVLDHYRMAWKFSCILFFLIMITVLLSSCITQTPIVTNVSQPDSGMLSVERCTLRYDMLLTGLSTRDCKTETIKTGSK